MEIVCITKFNVENYLLTIKYNLNTSCTGQMIKHVS